jgi:hypothetical protein
MMADDVFKLPQSSYEEITKVIKAYGHLASEVGLEEVSRLTSLHTTIISRNVGFLLAIGLLTPGSKKAATDLGRGLARALEHEMPDEIRNSWRQVVQECDFLSKLIAAIKIRNGMDQQTLESHIAYSAGQPKKAAVMTGSRTVIEILRAAELIREAEGKFVAATTSSSEDPGRTQLRVSTFDQAPVVKIERDVPPKMNLAAAQTAIGTSVALTINVNINCKPDEVEALGARLRELIDSIKEDKQPDA